MFQWNQTYVINSVTDTLSELPKVEFKSDVTYGEDKKTKTLNIFRVRRVADFDAKGIVAAYKNPYCEKVNGSVKIAIPTTESTNGVKGDPMRIKLYVRLSGSNNSYYANDFVFKGKPFIYEFKLGQTAKEIADLIKKINTLYDDKFLKVEGDDDNFITFTGDNYTMFTEVSIEKYGAENYSLSGGTWDVVYGLGAPEITVTNCVNGFGTFENILKDLRLPTLDNTNWTSANMEEMPIPGAKYDQYTIEYCKQVGVQGAAHIGDLVTAKTTHVFYVNRDIAGTTFESALNSALAKSGVKLLTMTMENKGGTEENDTPAGFPEVTEE